MKVLLYFFILGPPSFLVVWTIWVLTKSYLKEKNEIIFIRNAILSIFQVTHTQNFNIGHTISKLDQMHWPPEMVTAEKIEKALKSMIKSKQIVENEELENICVGEYRINRISKEYRLTNHRLKLPPPR